MIINNNQYNELALNLPTEPVAVKFVICIRKRLNVTNETTSMVKSEWEIQHYIFIKCIILNVKLLTPGIKIKIPPAPHWNVFDEISAPVEASIWFQVRKRQRKVHWFIAQTESDVIDAESINSVD